MKDTSWAQPTKPSAVEGDKRIVQAPRGTEVVSEIAAILAIHLAAALAVVWTIADLGIG